MIVNWNSAWGTVFLRGAGLVVNFIVLAIISQWAGKESLGILIALNGASFLGGVICSLGIPTHLLKLLPEFLLKAQGSEIIAYYRAGVIRALWVSCGGAIVIILFGLSQVSGWIPRFEGFGFVELVALCVGSAAMATQFISLSVIRVLRLPAWSSVFQFCTPPGLLLMGTSLLKLAANPISPEMAAVVAGTAMVANAGLAHCFVIKRVPHGASTHPVRFPWSELKSFWMLSAVNSSGNNSLLLIAAALFEPVQLANLGVPFRICNVPMTMVAAMGAYYSPVIREAVLSENLGARTRALIDSQRVGTILVLPLLVLAFLDPNRALGIFDINGVEAERCFLALAASQLVAAACGVSEQYLAMVGKAHVALRITVVATIGTALIGSLAAVRIGPVGLALSWGGLSALKQIALRLACIKA